MHSKFLKMICKNNLLFELCDNKSFKEFFQTLGFSVRSSTYYRTELLSEEADKKIKLIMSRFANKQFYLMLDETQNRKRESILNILIGDLKSKIYEQPVIIYSGVVENTKTETIKQVVDKTILPLLNRNLNKNNFKVFLSDGRLIAKNLDNNLKNSMVVFI